MKKFKYLSFAIAAIFIAFDMGVAYERGRIFTEFLNNKTES